MEVAPFAAVRYRPEAVGRVDDVVSLPYDQFDDAGRDARYAAHPHHVVRLIRPRLPEDAGERGAPATRGGPAALHRQAARAFRDWLDEGVLAVDPEPAVYPYRQRYVVPGESRRRERWAVLVRVALTDLGSGPVRAHERTFPETVGERSALREAVGADLGLVLMVHDDPTGELHDRVVAAAAGDPLAAVRDEAGVENALWGCSAPAGIAGLVEGLSARRAIIADGHHRYTAALQHWRGRGGRPDDPARWLLAALVSEADSGLTILPIHRLLASELAPDRVRQAGRGFAVDRLAAGTRGELLSRVRRALDAGATGHLFILVTRDGTEGAGSPVEASASSAEDGARLVAYRVTAPRGSQDDADWPAGVPDAWRRLDVTVLHQLVLEPALEGRLSGQRHDSGELAFTNDLAEALGSVAGGGRGAAILLRPLAWSRVREIVDAGGVLPAKSTNFHPKAIAGLAFSRFES